MRVFVATAVAATISGPTFAGEACRTSWEGYGNNGFEPRFLWEPGEAGGRFGFAGKIPGGGYVSEQVFVGGGGINVGSAHGGEIDAFARAVDGNTLDTSVGFRVRLAGMDAPGARETCTAGNGEEWQCGTEAISRLSALLVDGPWYRRLIEEITKKIGVERAKRFFRSSHPPPKMLSCRGDTCDSNGNLIAVCTLPDGGDVGAELVRAGLARDLPSEAPSYADAEREARRTRRGIWAEHIEDREVRSVLD